MESHGQTIGMGTGPTVYVVFSRVCLYMHIPYELISKQLLINTYSSHIEPYTFLVGEYKGGIQGTRVN